MIYHIANDTDWELHQNNSSYYPARFLEEGFIHCSTKVQVGRIANRLFKSHPQVWLLFIDDEKEKQFIKYENLEGGEELFPHIYRKLPKESIQQVVRLTKTGDVFEFPMLP